MDLERMLAKCKSQQWSVEDLDWGVTPRAMDRDAEMAIVQYFKDMAAIERLAGALFEEQRRLVSDETLKAIFASFVVDEERHAIAAERLAAHYDVHHHAAYRTTPELQRFALHFLNAVQFFTPEIANAYITGGELLLDIALLRSLNDYVHDEMSERAMELINRDESRHIAIDFYMTEFYASSRYQDLVAGQPRKPFADQLRAWRAFAGVLIAAGPFLERVFFAPMARVDPSGKRLREAVKRMQILGSRKGVRDRPFYKFMSTLRVANKHPLVGPILGRVTRRLSGNFPDEFAGQLYDAGELARADGMQIDELAEEALQAKYAN
ncbi:MAG TPA: hypothetical protein VH062_21480 [Polyangiaceae bacterium]|jgi:hypothetical protein|nr:hypothetical protein [Polyangiaceae bacterium]